MRILFLVSRLPYELDKGDKLRAYHQIRILSQKHEIILFSLTDEPVPAGAKEALEVFCKEVVIFPIAHSRPGASMLGSLPKKLPFQVAYYYNKEARGQVHALIQKHQPDHIFCQLVRMAEYVKKYTNIPKTLDYMDAFSKGVERRAELAPVYKKPFFLLESRLLKAYETRMFDLFIHKIIISEQDRYQIEHPHKYNIQIVPNGVDTDYYSPKPAEKKYDILLAGNMSYLPNIEAARFLVKKVMPLVWPYMSGVKVLIAGKNPAPEVKALASERVKVLGKVPDIREAYNAAKLFVAPLFSSTGLQNKILEAMAMRMPCITTRQVNSAIGGKKVAQILLADNAQGFAAHIMYLLHHPDEAAAMGEQGQLLVQRQYNWETLTARLEQLINPVV